MSISLEKGQKISLSKDGGSLTRVKMGLGWDPVSAPKKGGLFKRMAPEKQVDLDASAVLLDGQKQVVDTVWFKQLRSKDGSIVHTGDNLTGAGDGDDESILVDLTAVPASVETLAFTVNSFSSQGFGEVANAFCRVVDETTGTEFARYDLGAQGSHSAIVIAKVYRHGGEWKMAAIGDVGSGRTVAEILPLVQQVV
ncbi:MAG: TerD family protein [Solirubrobacteraceae bacterium]|nr:TerD family protein [Solirubrobacteraceae bacterium]